MRLFRPALAAAIKVDVVFELQLLDGILNLVQHSIVSVHRNAKHFRRYSPVFTGLVLGFLFSMEALRRLPPINDILRSEPLAKFQQLFAQPFFKRTLDMVLAETRTELLEGQAPSDSRSEMTVRIAREVEARLKKLLQPSLLRVINASGVILHTNLGRAPLPAAAIDRLREVSSGYCNLEFDLETGERSQRDVHAEGLIRQLLDAEAAIVVNNNAAAVLLVLNTFGEGGEVVASRGEQVEIGGSFRIPEVMAKSGAHLREVGATNRTRIEDYENAIEEKTRLLLRVHPSNFRITGFTARPSLEEFAALGKKKNIPTFEDLGSGCLSSLAFLGVSDEPIAADSIRAGVDVICFSGDKLLGGPQAGIVAGRKTYIERIRRNPLFRALRVDKLTIAVLESVLLSYLKGEVKDIPIWQILHAGEDDLRPRVEAFAARMAGIVEPVRLMSLVGGGSAPEAQLSSWGIALKIPNLSAMELEERLRHSEPPVIARIEEGRVVLDFRTIFPGEEAELFAALQRLT